MSDFISVVSVKAQNDHEISIEFSDGKRGVFDASPYFTLGKFSELKDPQLFRTVKKRFDTIEWDNKIDLDPEFLYEQSVATP